MWRRSRWRAASSRPGPSRRSRGDGAGAAWRAGWNAGGPGRGFGGVIFADLTEQQREQIKAIHDGQREGQQGPPADGKLRQQLELELLADTPNDQAIETLKQQIVTAQLEQLSQHIAVQKQVTQVLTAEQRAKARERVAQGPGPDGPGRGRRGGGGFGFGLKPRH